MTMIFQYNTVMNRRRKGRILQKSKTYLLPVFLLLIAAAAVFLGYLQFRWVNRVTSAEGSRLKQSLRSSAVQVLNAGGDETRVLQALLYITGEEYSGKDWSRFSSSFEFWKTNSRFPNLLAAVHLIVLQDQEEESVFLQYRPEGGVFTSADRPQRFEGLTLNEDPNDPYTRAEVEELIHRGVFLSPVGLPGKKGTDRSSDTRFTPSPRFPAFLVLTVDLDVVYREVIPFYMNQYLEGHPYRISETGTGNTVVSYGDPDPAREPELSITPRTPLLFWNRLAGEEARDEERESTLAQDLLEAYVQQHLGEDPNVRFWLQRSKMLGMDPGRPPGSDGGREASIRLDIFYPGGPIRTLVSTRRTVNLSVSVGLLLLLLASSVILFRLYRNTTRLRATEQEFVASMSHELRTPIAVLQSTTENLKSGVVSDPTRVSRYGEIIHRETKRLAGMVEGILLYSGLEKRTPRSTATVVVDLENLINEVVTSLQEPAREARCKIHSIKKTTVAAIRSDPTALRLILENLLLNAIRHGLPVDRSEGDPAEIRLIAEQKVFHRGLLIIVEDDGPGIPSKEARRIFEPFVRGEASIRAQRPGSGLGLHLVRRVVRILGGSITLESPYQNAVGQIQTGCRFTVDLPGTDSENHAEDPDR